MKDLRRLFLENHISLIFVALVAGLIAPGLFRVFYPWNTLLLQVIFFLSALQVDFAELKSYAVDWKMHVLTDGFMLVVLPLAVYFPLSLYAPDWALAFLVALAAPTGMTIALVADYFGGKTALALVITVTTSLLAPFTLPVVAQLSVGRSVPIDSLGMLRSLAEAIIIPFVLAFLVHRFAPGIKKRGDRAWRTISMTAFGLLIASIVSKTTGGHGLRGADGTLAISFVDRDALMLLLVFLYIAGLIWVSYRMVYWRSVAERITIALCMVYMNFSLSLYIADRFFAAQRIVPKLIIILLLLNLMLPALKIAAARLVAHGVRAR